MLYYKIKLILVLEAIVVQEKEVTVTSTLILYYRKCASDICDFLCTQI